MRNLDGLKMGRGWNKGKCTPLAIRQKISKATKNAMKNIVLPHTKSKLRKVCPCGLVFFVIPSLDRIKHCSQSCARIGKPSPRKGMKNTEIHKQRVAEAHRTWRDRNPGKIHWNKYHDSSLLKKSEKKHLDTQYREWMLQVKKRDSWKCKIANEGCKGRLEAHHILNWVDFPGLRYEVNNGITLCHAHHPRGRAQEKRLQAEFQLLVSASK